MGFKYFVFSSALLDAYIVQLSPLCIKHLLSVSLPVVDTYDCKSIRKSLGYEYLKIVLAGQQGFARNPPRAACLGKGRRFLKKGFFVAGRMLVEGIIAPLINFYLEGN